jgi:hypothetical protein
LLLRRLAIVQTKSIEFDAEVKWVENPIMWLVKWSLTQSVSWRSDIEDGPPIFDWRLYRGPPRTVRGIRRADQNLDREYDAVGRRRHADQGSSTRSQHLITRKHNLGDVRLAEVTRISVLSSGSLLFCEY